MAITAAQKVAIEEIINLLCTTTATRGKRQVAGMFLDLVDRTDWPQYYEASHDFFFENEWLIHLRFRSFRNRVV